MRRILLCCAERWKHGDLAKLQVFWRFKAPWKLTLSRTYWEQRHKETFFLSLKLLYLIIQKVLHFTSAPLKWSPSFRLPIGKEMTLRHRELTAVTWVFSMSTGNRDAFCKQLFVKLTFGWFGFYLVPWKYINSPKSLSKKGHPMNSNETDNEWTPIASWRPH